MSLQQHMPQHPRAAGTADAFPGGIPSTAQAVASALGSVRAEGLEPDDAGLALLDAVAAGELSTEQAVARAVALYAA